MKNQAISQKVFAALEFPVGLQTYVAVAVPLLILAVIACAAYKFYKGNKKLKNVNHGEA